MSEKDNVFDYVMNSPEDTNPSVLRSLLNDIPEGGSGSQEFPTPSADNVGKIARVVSDGQGGYAWSAENQEEKFVITGSNLDDSDYSFTIDKTYNEILAAYESGQQLVLNIHDPVGGNSSMPLAFIGGEQEGFVFQFTFNMDGQLRFFRYVISQEYCIYYWWIVSTDLP